LPEVLGKRRKKVSRAFQKGAFLLTLARKKLNHLTCERRRREERHLFEKPWEVLKRTSTS
jgi:hypothetical protein